MMYKLGNITRNSWNSWDRVPRDPTYIGTAILSAFGSTGATLATTTFLNATGAYIVGTIAISVVTSYAVSALMPKPDFGNLNSSAGRLMTSREAIQPQQYIYGEVRKGGTIVSLSTSGTNNSSLHMVIAIAGHEVADISDIYINDEIVTLVDNGSFYQGVVTTEPWNTIRVLKYD